MLPGDRDSLVAFALMMVLAMWGGLANYIYRIKSGAVKMFSFIELLGEWVISGFSGVLVYLVATHYGVDPLLVAVMVAIAGHAGARATFLIEQFFARKLTGLADRINKG